MNRFEHEGCRPRQYAGQLPRHIQCAARCQLNLDLGASGSASSTSAGGATQFGNVTIGTLGGSGNGTTGISLTTVAVVGAVIALAMWFFFFRKK